ncbi:MAG: winged helix-turn-helix domain-containing protein [Deltaproteobacteria bacterium]|nr:winged helix-turn-helix domain-containing protein [Deltaproteobacteria bacterium]
MITGSATPPGKRVSRSCRSGRRIKELSYPLDFRYIQISKAQLANLLDTGPESLSRALGNMKGKKLIAEEGASIRLLDRGLLQKLAESGKAPR